MMQFFPSSGTIVKWLIGLALILILVGTGLIVRGVYIQGTLNDQIAAKTDEILVYAVDNETKIETQKQAMSDWIAQTTQWIETLSKQSPKSVRVPKPPPIPTALSEGNRIDPKSLARPTPLPGNSSRKLRKPRTPKPTFFERLFGIKPKPKQKH